MVPFISAVNNPHIKEIRSLRDKDTRYSLKKFVVEGINIIKDLPDNLQFELYYTDNRADEIASIAHRANAVYQVNDKVMNAMSETVNPSGILAVVDMDIQDFGASDRVLYLDGIADPGNMGTIIRTAVALGIEDIIAVSSVDPYSGKVIRASMGGIFNTRITSCSPDKAYELIKDYNVYILDMNGENIFDKSFTIDNKRFVLAVGNEAHGVSQALRDRADRVLSLPMTDKMESLNAGVSLSTALYRIIYL